MANNRMYFVCNLCLPEGKKYDYSKWRESSLHLAKWYPDQNGSWYTNNISKDNSYSKKLDEFLEIHAHSNIYKNGVENPVRLKYEWIGTPIEQ